MNSTEIILSSYDDHSDRHNFTMFFTLHIDTMQNGCSHNTLTNAYSGQMNTRLNPITQSLFPKKRHDSVSVCAVANKVEVDRSTDL